MKKNNKIKAISIICSIVVFACGSVMLYLVTERYNIIRKLAGYIIEKEQYIFVLETVALILLTIGVYFLTVSLLQSNRARDVIPVMFVGAVFLFPLLVGWKTEANIDDTENRGMAEKPIWGSCELSEYIDEWGNYIVDNVPFRKLWLRNNGLVKYGIFHSSLNKLSMPGKDGWIYIGSTGTNPKEDTIADYKKTNLFTERELKDLAKSLNGFKNYLESQQIEFRLLITLNKSHIYPEHLPENLIVGEGMTRAEQVIEYLQYETDIEVVYIKDALLKEKENYELYCPTDAHWNTVGGYVGFRELMKSFESNKTYPEIADINPVYERTNWADVANIANAAWFTNNRWSTTTYKDEIVTEWIPRSESDSSAYIVNLQGNGKNILVYHDSFMNQMMTYLGKEFSRCEFIEKEFDIAEEDILEKNPDVVVFEILERMLNNYRDELRYWQKYN